VDLKRDENESLGITKQTAPESKVVVLSPPPNGPRIEDRDLGVQVVIAPSAVAHLDESGIAALGDALEREAQEYVLEAQRVTVHHAHEPFARSTAADVHAAIERIRQNRAQSVSRATRYMRIVRDLSLVGMGAGFGYLASYPKTALAIVLGCWIVYNWANAKNPD
jgi:hypothetical protein